ncbi:MAG: type II toxin-antitoxin system HicB family antitoxin [Chloroflexi bacterium]|nr:type II toxin-antitoxin system HicB family antitoxin [Chloroflexota bacterium]
MEYTIIIEKGRESGYVAFAPALKGCVSQGETKEEALRNIKEAMEVYVEALLEDASCCSGGGEPCQAISLQ